jgi:hypothetical protein
MAYQKVLFGAYIPQNNHPLHYSSKRNRFKMERFVSYVMLIYTKVHFNQYSIVIIVTGLWSGRSGFRITVGTILRISGAVPSFALFTVIIVINFT